MARTPYKMKGNPMQRNYGIPTPVRNEKKDKRTNIRKGWDKLTQIGMGFKGALTAVDDFYGSAKYAYKKEKAADEKAGRS